MSQGQNPPETPEAAARTLQIIVGALMISVMSYGGFVLKQGGLAGPPQPPSTATMAAGMALVSFVMHLVIPPIIAKSAVQGSGGEERFLLGAYMTKTIVAGALLEGAAFFNLFALSTEHQWWSLAIVVVLLLAMAALIPSSIRIAHWVEAKQLEVR